MTRRSRLGVGFCAVMLCLSQTIGVSALEQPPAFTDEDLRIGTEMTPLEAEDAAVFCQDTLAREAVSSASIGTTCACFAPAWGYRTSHLHRLVLPIVWTPETPEARRNIALIFRAQNGIHEDKLKQLADEYQIAAQQAFRACR